MPSATISAPSPDAKLTRAAASVTRTGSRSTPEVSSRSSLMMLGASFYMWARLEKPAPVSSMARRTPIE